MHFGLPLGLDAPWERVCIVAVASPLRRPRPSSHKKEKDKKEPEKRRRSSFLTWRRGIVRERRSSETSTLGNCRLADVRCVKPRYPHRINEIRDVE